MDSIIAVALVAFGACIGSFLNVVALRFISGEDVVRKPSHCPHCYRPLAWFELIPIVSYILLRGRCWTCKKPISIQYPLVEAITAFIAFNIFSPYLVADSTLLVPILMFIIACIIIVLAIIDTHTMILPDMWIVALTVGVLAKMLLEKNTSLLPWTGALIGGAFLLLLWILTGKKGIGLGDVKLVVPLGLLAGWPGVMTLLLIAFCGGGLFGSYLLITKQATRKTAVPFGPFLAMAALLFIIWPTLPAATLQLLGWP